MKADIKRWLEVMNELPLKWIYRNQLVAFIYLLGSFPEFRNLAYYRLQGYVFFLNKLCRQMSTIILGTKVIGEGLFIRHGVASAIGGKSIGNNCMIYQQVTITEDVTIKDNVTVYAGAVLIGDITIGNNVIIGANCTVIKDVPDNCTVLPMNSKVIRWKV